MSNEHLHTTPFEHAYITGLLTLEHKSLREIGRKGLLPCHPHHGVYRIDFACREGGGSKYHIYAHEGGVQVMRFWGRVFLYDPDFGKPGWKPEVWGDGELCLHAPSQGGIEVFLKRFRDGQWVRSYREARVVAGEDGGPRLELGELEVNLVREEELPFEFIPDPSTSSGQRVLDRLPPPAPIWGPRGFCLQPGAGWPWNVRPGNTNPSYPPVAPENPPAYFYSYGRGFDGPVSIHYVNEKYAVIISHANFYATPALPPSDEPYRLVTYSTWTDPVFPRYGRWVRIYTRQPLVVRLEGDRLICQNGDEGDWVYEMMPEGFNFPGFDPSRRNFDIFQTPYNLPPELDPYRGVRAELAALRARLEELAE